MVQSTQHPQPPFHPPSSSPCPSHQALLQAESAVHVENEVVADESNDNPAWTMIGDVPSAVAGGSSDSLLVVHLF